MDLKGVVQNILYKDFHLKCILGFFYNQVGQNSVIFKEFIKKIRLLKSKIFIKKIVKKIPVATKFFIKKIVKKIPLRGDFLYN